MCGWRTSTTAPRGDMCRQIVALLQVRPARRSPTQTRQLLGVDQDLDATMQTMVRDGLRRRIATGQSVASVRHGHEG